MVGSAYLVARLLVGRHLDAVPYQQAATAVELEQPPGPGTSAQASVDSASTYHPVVGSAGGSVDWSGQVGTAFPFELYVLLALEPESVPGTVVGMVALAVSYLAGHPGRKDAERGTEG